MNRDQMSLMRYRIFNLASRANASPRTIQQSRQQAQQAQQKRIRETKQPEYTLADLLEDVSNLSDENFEILISQMNHKEKQDLLEVFDQFENFVTTLVENNYVDSLQLEMIVEAKLSAEEQLKNFKNKQNTLKDSIVKLGDKLRGAAGIDKPYLEGEIKRKEEQLEKIENRIKNLSKSLTVADASKVVDTPPESKEEPTLFDTGESKPPVVSTPATPPSAPTSIDQKLIDAKKNLEAMKSALRSGKGSTVEIRKVDPKEAGLGATSVSQLKSRTAPPTETTPPTPKPTETTPPISKPTETAPPISKPTETAPETSPETSPETAPETQRLTVGNIIKKFVSKNKVAHYLNQFLNFIDPKNPKYSRIRALLQGLDYQPIKKFEDSKAGFRDFSSKTPTSELIQHFQTKFSEYQQQIQKLEDAIEKEENAEEPDVQKLSLLQNALGKYKDKAANAKNQIEKRGGTIKKESKYFDNNTLHLVECLKNMNKTQTKAYYDSLNTKEQIILEQILCEYVNSQGTI